MAIEGKMAVVKYLTFFFNFLFFLSGLALVIVGGVIRSKYGDYLSFADSKFASAAIFIIVVGVIVFIIGFLGCCGAVKENYCMVTTFAVLLGVIFVLEIIAGSVGFAYRSKVKETADKGLKRAIDNYDNDKEKGAKDFVDWVQTEFTCCGMDGASDWQTALPASCCDADVKNCTITTAHQEGCLLKFEEFVHDNLVVIGAVAIAIAFIQLLGIVFACCLMKAIKNQYEVV